MPKVIVLIVITLIILLILLLILDATRIKSGYKSRHTQTKKRRHKLRRSETRKDLRNISHTDELGSDWTPPGDYFLSTDASSGYGWTTTNPANQEDLRSISHTMNPGSVWKMCPDSKHFNKMQSQGLCNGPEQHNKDLWTREIVKMRPEHVSCKPCKAKTSQMRIYITANSFAFG